MKYRSTRGRSELLSFAEALERGLAPDGGLYVPEDLPAFDFAACPTELPLAAFAARWIRGYVGEEDPLASSLDEICASAFNFPIPVVPLGERLSVLELFHGPTAAFKDVGARFLAECVSHLSTEERTVLVATSGDTGGAVAAAFYGRPKVEVLVLFPEGRVSKRQQKQLTAWGGNVKAFAVRGSFDDCQRIVKEAFANDGWRSRRLVSANSINIGRLIPQSMYYAHATASHQRRYGRPPTFVVPTGNLGNGLAALWAKARGAPIDSVRLACNANTTLSDFFATGAFAPKASIVTLANAMDVGNPSNFERLLALYGAEKVREHVSATSVSDPQIEAAIRETYSRFAYVACPHTAAAFHVAESMADADRIVVATAHPAKFETIVEPLLGRPIEVPPSLTALFTKEERFQTIEPSLDALERASRS